MTTACTSRFGPSRVWLGPVPRRPAPLVMLALDALNLLTHTEEPSPWAA